MRSLHYNLSWLKSSLNVIGQIYVVLRKLIAFLLFLFSSFLFFSGTQWRRSLFFYSPSSLIFPACSPVLSDLLRYSLCTVLQTEKLWIWSTGLSTLLTPSSRREAWVLGNLTALTERSQRVIRWTRGRGGESCVLRLFPWRTLISTYSEPW